MVKLVISRITACMALIVAVACSSVIGDEPEPGWDVQLERELLPMIRQHDGEVSLAIKNLETGARYAYLANKPRPTASLIKFPLLIAAYRAVDNGSIELDQPIELHDDDKVPGSGILTEHLSSGVSLPFRDYLRLMMRFSDNTATNIVIDEIGLATTSALMEELECPHTKLHSKVYRRDTSIDPERSRQFGLGSTTASEMIRLFELLYRNQLAKPDSHDAMRNHLRSCDDQTKLARFLPSSTKILHKTGGIANCRTDAGIIETHSGPIAVCVLTNHNSDQSWGEGNAANVLCARIGRVIVGRFGAVAVQSGLREGAVGRLVEALQRTLNARLDPSPNLAIDGDFGPATHAAVERFQRSRSLPENGVVSPNTWQALGSLIDKDGPVAEPEIVNGEVLATVPQLGLLDPPIVTCKAWLIGDRKTGQIVAEVDSNRELQAASTTKIMTALVVLELADRDPSVLDEVVTFSLSADTTIGSTSGVRTGERVSVRDLLFGLLLPSGNDASVALGEHIGARFAAEKTGTDQASAYDQFVLQMNLTAHRLGLTKANYRNTHGLPDAGHVISAADLFRLAHYAMRNDLFREIVSTRQYGCTVVSDTGYKRNLIWRNTNQLLNVDGYTGVKTGTTKAAGACLVSCGQLDGDELIVVVLGSSSSPSRYADTRNLFRWAWRNRRAASEP